MKNNFNHKFTYTLCEDAYWESRIIIIDEHGYEVSDLKLYAYEKINENIMLGLKRGLINVLMGAQNLEGIEGEAV